MHTQQKEQFRVSLGIVASVQQKMSKNLEAGHPIVMWMYGQTLRSQLRFKVYYLIALLLHVSAYIKNVIMRRIKRHQRKINKHCKFKHSRYNRDFDFTVM